MIDNRIVCWYSDGAASAVAAKLTLAQHGHDNVVVARIETGAEHPDNPRFRAEVQQWLDHPIVELRSTKYRDTWQVWEERRYIVGPAGAPCTGLLKKQVRFGFQRPGDVQVFGYTADWRDARRADRFREENFDVDMRTPLIERGLTKADCLGIIDALGIELPWMYRNGYQNNNCIGCVKGGIGYWNKIRRDFPDVFARMAELEQRLGATVLREKPAGKGQSSRPLPLITLDPTRGNHADEPDFECSVLCSIAADELAADTPARAAA